MNILILEGSKHWTGGAKRAFLLIKELKKQGHNIIVVSPPRALLGEKCALEGLAVYTFMPIGGMGIFSFLKILKILKTHKISIVDIHSSVFYRTGGLAGKITGAKVVFTRNVAFRKNSLKKVINRAMYALADRIITVSEQIKADLVSDFSLDSKKVEVIVDGIDVNELTVTPDETERVKKEFNIGSEPVIGVITRMDKTKGHKFLIEGIPKVISKAPSIKFIITGIGKLAGEIKNYADSLNLGNNVIFTGFRNDIPAILSVVNLTVMPSYNEGLGMCILESLAAGKPVVAVNTGGIPEVVINEYDGILVNSCTAEDLSSGIIKILNSDLKKLGENGKKLILGKFSIEKMGRSTIGVYEELMS
ncbi:MAG: glycosyltransferase family 4 protein [Elusimicrobia bacterium]|nr:glycosyltransferase family 4 protein [Elusimicrobiota bacterium]MBU2614855.1 glycosyltransferase family 4 protein [Elusimicrobiota bacterium]